MKRKYVRHGFYRTKFYHVYYAILERCNNPKTANFHLYGGRGIKCLWNTFEDFRDDMYKSYREGLCLDRRDSDGDYCAENCRWVTHKQNNRNTRFNVRYPYQGKMLCLGEISEITGIKRGTLYYRIDIAKWPIDKATDPMVQYRYA